MTLDFFLTHIMANAKIGPFELPRYAFRSKVYSNKELAYFTKFSTESDIIAELARFVSASVLGETPKEDLSKYLSTLLAKCVDYDFYIGSDRFVKYVSIITPLMIIVNPKTSDLFSISNVREECIESGSIESMVEWFRDNSDILILEVPFFSYMMSHFRDHVIIDDRDENVMITEFNEIMRSLIR